MPELLKRFSAAFTVVCLFATGCESGEQFYFPADAAPQSRALRIYSNPYEAVDWLNDRRLIAQHHDHVSRIEFILAYDKAGYDVVSLMDYSGNPSMPHARRERLWPPDRWVATSQMPYLNSIELFLPNAEEVGIKGEPLRHVTSPFLTTYIEGASDAQSPRLPNQYRSLDELFSLVRSLDGYPCLAHPWNYKFQHFRLRLGDSYCVEIYSAFAEMQKERGSPYFSRVDRNRTVIDGWDEALQENQSVFGIAVNDHAGPQMAAGTISNRVRDSGKIVVIAKAATLEAYKEAFTAGSFFAVRDYGETKNRHPEIHSIVVGDGFVFLETLAAVKWIAQGREVASTPVLSLESVPAGARYVRAEVSDDSGSTVYTQAFAIRPVGDVDGDYEVSSADEERCRTLAVDSARVHVSACQAAGWLPGRAYPGNR